MTEQERDNNSSDDHKELKLTYKEPDELKREKQHLYNELLFIRRLYKVD